MIKKIMVILLMREIAKRADIDCTIAAKNMGFLAAMAVNEACKKLSDPSYHPSHLDRHEQPESTGNSIRS